MVHSDDADDQWSDAHDTLDDNQDGQPQSIEQVDVQQDDPDLTVKITQNHQKDSQSPMLESSIGHSLSTSPDQVSDVASTHSLPVTHVSEPDATPIRRPSTVTTSHHSTPSASHVPPPSPTQSNMSTGHATTVQQRRNRHRSAVEVRSSSRLSGFLTNLIYRRDNPPNSGPRNTVQGDTTLSSTHKPASAAASRSSSPAPRPITPPPQLPPPTLQELGLSLSALTADLSPTHSSSSPSSGTFLAPNYLLLCHSQGLDVLPLKSPPAPKPYTLVPRVNFKSVVVMEHRGVLVAIAGRRDGVRVYALEEVKRAIEWRIEIEIRRERERIRRETARKVALSSFETDSVEKPRMASLSTPPMGETKIRGKLTRKGSYGSSVAPSPVVPPVPPPTPLIPRRPTTRSKKIRSRTMPNTPQSSDGVSQPLDQPPPYSVTSELPSSEPRQLRSSASIISLRARSRSSSVSNVLAAAPFSRRNTTASITRIPHPDAKPDRIDSSDDEAINVVAAGSSGSQALDERTSATHAAHSSATQPSLGWTPTPAMSRRGRPANLDLSASRPNGSAPPSEPSPAPTLLTLRQALSSPPNREGHPPSERPPIAASHVEEEDDDDVVEGEISLAQALFESRMPNLPPIGTRQPQEAILITASSPTAAGDEEPSSPRTSQHDSGLQPRRRRRWSVILGSSNSQPASPTSIPTLTPSPLAVDHPSATSFSSPQLNGHRQPGSLDSRISLNSEGLPSSHSRSRFIPRIISNALHGRRSDEQPQALTQRVSEVDPLKKSGATSTAPQASPPKLEYIKLPGTKGALMIKAIETAKKSFLAILCGENGEKVELFAGTYRTALALSRTFILPDSPRSLELQLQGDDLVEVFLVFSQNVFGLEPATVRVREVRIGRAELRAARRRARERRTGDGGTNDAENAADEDTNVNVNIGVSLSVDSNNEAADHGVLVPNQHPDGPQTPVDQTNTTLTHAEEVVALATAQVGPYTTFQQLSFAPKFPLASIADDYIIPPTYPDFLGYRSKHEPESNRSTSEVQFSPPGLPIPAPTVPSMWYYRDPKDIVHGPWKASLMQAWYKDGLLPPDLPVRRAEDTEFILLKDLRLQSVDPTHPFHSPPPLPPPPVQIYVSPLIHDPGKPLLPPISLLAQPRHFGPPPFFFSSRGGHSTTIVDARGRSVLKGRFLWTADENDDGAKPTLLCRMGDITRLEAFDIQDRSVLVAMRQGGLEVVDFSDALLKPADESRAVLPQFDPPPSNINRRGPFVWKIGSPVASSPNTSTILSSKPKTNHMNIIAGKRQTSGSARSPANKSEFSIIDSDCDVHEEMLFLGRKDDEIYICERNFNTFRILRLSPS